MKKLVPFKMFLGISFLLCPASQRPFSRQTVFSLAVLLMHTQKICSPPVLLCGKKSGCLTWLSAVSIHVVAFLPCPPRFAGKNSGLLSRPVFCGKKLGLSDWLIAFYLRLCPLSYPARLTLREILYRVSSRPVLISGKKRGLIRLLAVSLF